MSLVIADEIQAVRDMLGDPDTTELPTANMTRFFTTDALRWINLRRPAVAISSFTTVADQQDYDSKPANAYRIREVFWLDSTAGVPSTSIESYMQTQDFSIDMGGLSIFDNPAIVTAFYQKITQYEDYFKGEGKETEEGKIGLYPAPTVAGDTVYFTYEYPRWALVTAVSSEYVEAVRNIAAASAARFLAIRRGKITSGRNWSGGGGNLENEMRKEFLSEAERLAPEHFGVSIG